MKTDGATTRKAFLSVSLLLVASSASSAGIDMRPGLWEVTTSSALLALVPQIPPDQLEKLTSMAKQYGLDVPQIKNGAATSKVCVTQQMADQKIPSFFHPNQTGCRIKNAIQAESSYKMDVICTDARFKGNGRVEATFTSPESFSAWTTFNGTSQDTAVSEHADTTGRWISASCGGVKPLY